MSEPFFALYDALLSGVGGDCPVEHAALAPRWAMAEVAGGMGIAMATPGDSIQPFFPGGLEGLPVCRAAQAVKSWNLSEAGVGLAAVNAWYNTPARMEALGCYLPMERHYAGDIDFGGMTVGLIGHMHGPPGMREQAKEVYIIEKQPRPGDYPDSACDYILPRCDLVIITGSSLVNKTLPHLLDLCQNAYTILAGPSVPMCPELLDFGIDQLAGMVVTDQSGLRAHVNEGRRGSPYPYSVPFVLK